MDLRDYQIEAIDGASSKIAAGGKRVLIVCPTGGGKTVIASEIIRRAVSKGRRVLFLAHRRELILQTCDKLYRFGVRHGVVMAGIRPALQEPVQVASVQTMMRRQGALSHVDLIFLDEAHHATTENQYAQVLAWFPQAKVVGLTATPWRLDGRGLADVFDAHVLARTPRELRDDGFLVPVGGWEYESIDTEGIAIRRGDYAQAELEKRATSSRIVGNVVSEWQKEAAGKRTVLFATSVDHSMLMVGEFQKLGIPAEHIDGEMPTAERDAVLQRLRSGKTLIVSNCNVLTEGFDCPEIECVVLARPTLSTSLYLQMVGRGLRPAPGKSIARIHDHAGCLATHGHPYEDRDYEPTTTGRVGREEAERSQAQRKKRCTQCQSVIAKWPCDACGFQPDPRELQLEFEEAARKRAIEEGERRAREKKNEETDEDRARRWRTKFANDAVWKRGFYARMFAKHGAGKAERVYWWFSGKQESPPREWVLEEQSARATA